MLRRASLALIGGMVVACGPDPGPVKWLDARAAAVHCTSSGRDLMPPVLVDLPVPKPPSGMYARGLDPMALNDLGFTRDTTACAMLLAPEPDATELTRASIVSLVEAQKTASTEAVAAGGRCTCEVAASLGHRGLLPKCVIQPTRAQCDPTQNRDEVEAALQPLLDTLPLARPPLVHWRLVGKTDREDWFAHRQSTLLEQYEGGSTIYVRGEAVPLRDNALLLRALLDEEGVRAVAHQDSGRSLLVVRELSGMLVLDHFSYPVVEARTLSLLAAIDNAAIDRYRALLAMPLQTRKLMRAPGKGNLVEVDVGLLDDVDDMIDAAAPLAQIRTRRARELPERRIDAVVIQAPFGEEGKVLEAEVALSEEGEAWATLLTNQNLTPTLDELGPIDPPVIPRVVGQAGSRLPYVLRGSDFETIVVYGLERVPGLMDRIEERYPMSVEGTARDWEFTMPPSDMLGLVGEDASFRGLRTAFEQETYVVEVEVEDGKPRLQARAAPK